jgi:hypothetical protein
MTEADTSRCTSCGGEHLAWRVHRTGTRPLQHSLREILWSCRACGHEWREPLDLRPEPLNPSPT